MTTKMKRFLGILLSLALVLGLMPGMSLAVVAENTKNVMIVTTNENGVQETITDSTTIPGAFTAETLIGRLYLWYDDETGITVTGSNASITNQTAKKRNTEITISGEGSFGVTVTHPYGAASFTVTVTELVNVTNVSLNPTSAFLTVGGDAVALTATIEPNDATDRKVKWSVGGDNAGAVKLYSDEACTTEVGADATNTLTVYAKGISAGDAAVKATSNADGTRFDICLVTVNKADPVYVIPTGLSAFVGQTLADVALPTANNGTWSWEEDTTTKLNDIGMTTYHAKFTPNETDKYNIIENIEVQILVTEKPFAVPATVTANSRTYDGTEKPLVNVDDSTLVGGTMQYALGTKDAATGTYSASIPTGTDAGTYYVWYKAVGDADHTDSEAKCVTVTIAAEEKKPEEKKEELEDDDPTDGIVSVNISGGIYRINITQGYATFIKPNSNPGKSFRVLDEAEYSGTKYPVIGIEPEAFKDLKDLETVTLGAKIQEIGQDAFAGSKVKYVHYAGIKAQWKKIKIGMGNDPLKKATRYYKSSGPITKLTLSKTSKTLKVGKTLTLTAKTTPKNAAPKFKWTSSKPNIASVKNGVVKAKKSGKTTITCEALDGSGLKVKCKIQVK